MKFIADILEKTWENVSDSSIDKNIYIGFKNKESNTIIFNNLSFGFSIFDESDIIYEEKFPEDGKSFLSTDQELIGFFSLNKLKLGKGYILKIWSENDNEKWEDVFSISIPMPPKPYESWTWDEETEQWKPLVPYPLDNDLYIWNEKEKRWDKSEGS